MTVRYFYYRNYPPRICIDLFYQFYKSDYAVDCTQRESSNILRSLEILLPRRLCKFQVAFFANGARAQPRVSAVHRVFLFFLFTLAWHSSLLERRIAIYNSRKWNYYSPRIENYHFSPIYFSRPPTRSLPVVHHFLESLFIFCTFEKPRGKFIRTIIPFDNRDRSIISNRKFPTRYHRSIVSIPPRYLHLFLHLRSSKLVKKKRKKNITRVEFAKIYDTGSFAKVARGDTVERGWRAFDKWIEITNYPRPFRRGFAFDKERGDWFLSEIERERSIVIIRTWTVAGFCAPRVSCTTRCSRSSARIDSRLLSYRSRAIDVTENRSGGGGGERRGMDFAFACGRACVGARA